MFKTVLSLALAAAAALPTVASASEAEQNSFRYDGSEYTYTVAPAGERQVVTGKTSDGAEFRLVVSDTHVRGTFNGQYVSFSRASVEPLGKVLVAQR
ncbi:hypothetical protein [Croceicoccus bisphenolivorans]|uniref:hypothetical protein n=1 Tax=Croceicoccus bisphenolivorans TaxID=1783232 RepID=UPI00082970A3|nr:hypothetical protein [Croceicoccus bisphenolivorans]